MSLLSDFELNKISHFNDHVISFNLIFCSFRSCLMFIFGKCLVILFVSIIMKISVYVAIDQIHLGHN